MALSPFFDHLSEVFGKTPRLGVCHIGAHKGQEVEIYKEAGFNKIILVEPSPRLAYGLLKLYIKDPTVRYQFQARNSEVLLDQMGSTPLTFTTNRWHVPFYLCSLSSFIHGP